MATAPLTAPIQSNFISAAESMVVLCGVTMDDRTVIAFVLKELVAQGYLTPRLVAVERRFRPPKQIAAFAPGPILGPSGNTVLDSMLAMVLQAAPASGRSVEEDAREHHEMAWATLRSEIDLSVKSGSPISFKRTRDAVNRFGNPALQFRTFQDGTVGVPVDEITRSVLLKHAIKGWRAVGHDFVRSGVLPALVGRGYFAYERRDRLRWTRRRFYEYQRQPTAAGLREREHLEASLNIRRALLRVRTCTHALDHFLFSISTTGNLMEIKATFDAIDGGVARAWADFYPD